MEVNVRVREGCFIEIFGIIPGEILKRFFRGTEIFRENCGSHLTLS